MRVAFLLFALLVFAVVATLAGARAHWRTEVAAGVARLHAAATHAGPEAFHPAMLESLPAPAARYLRAVLRDGTPIVSHVVIRHRGTLRADSARREWLRFRSVQHFTARTPGFVWDAEIRMVPILPVYVRDELVAGTGAMRGRAGALVPVVEAAGTPALAEGALHRWLAEAAWFPTALLPSSFLAWSALDDSTALVTATAGRATASLAFRFGPDSLVRFVEAPARPRDVHGVAVPTPWRATFSLWAWRGGMRVPMHAEAEWGLPSGPFACYRGRIEDATYD